jgi:hypothetical protein
MVDDEVWRPCTKSNKYEISNGGKVRNSKTGRILKPANKGGYMSVGLTINDLRKTQSIHQLVGLTFIDNPENKPHINHIDKNKSNNHVNNLEWCTPAENNAHKFLTLTSTTNQNLKLWRVDSVTNERLELYNSIHDAAKWCVANNYVSSEHNARGYISYALKRDNAKLTCGFIWMLNEQRTLENEIWKNVNIDGKIFDNYSVSSLGRFKNSKGVIMEQYKPHHSGYIYVRVNKIKYALHRLVASTFIDATLSNLVVNHIDGNKTNNQVINLEWCSIKENNQHNHNIGLIKVFKRKIGQYTLDNVLIKEFNSIVEAMRETNVTSIKNVLYNKQKTAGGFIWKYLD